MRLLAVVLSLHFLPTGVAQRAAEQYVKRTTVEVGASDGTIAHCRRRSSRNFACTAVYDGVTYGDMDGWTIEEGISVTRTRWGVRVRSGLFG